MFGRKTLEEKISALVLKEFEEIIADLEEDHREYRRRLELKGETRAALEDAEAKEEKLRSDMIVLKKRFWEAYYENDEAGLYEIESQSRHLEHARKRTEKSLKKARVNFERADFDEVAEGFALKTKANIAEDAVTRRIGAIEETLEGLFAGVRHEVEEASQALRDGFEEPRFETAEEQKAHEKRTIEIRSLVAESYTPDFRWGPPRGDRNAHEGSGKPSHEEETPRETVTAPEAPTPRSWWRRLFGG
jgi:hypothetical protein